MAFNILVDYDNLNHTDKSRDLLYLADKIIHKFSLSETVERHVQIRLYGGWYENNLITRKAQNLRTEILRHFPAKITLSDNTSAAIVNVELALSLYSAPSIDLFNTYRRRGNPSGLICEDPSSLGCAEVSCPVANVYSFFKNKKCDRCNTIKVDDVIFRQEQKLIDTMLTTDLIDISSLNKRVCLTSSDDDMWPGILYSIAKGAKVFHMLTKTTAAPLHYSQIVKSNYFPKTLLP